MAEEDEQELELEEAEPPEESPLEDCPPCKAGALCLDGNILPTWRRC